MITTTADLGRALLGPALVGFRQRFPAVRLRVRLATELVDLMGEGVDLALRVGKPGQQGLIARKLGELTAGFFAAPRSHPDGSDDRPMRVVSSCSAASYFRGDLELTERVIEMLNAPKK